MPYTVAGTLKLPETGQPAAGVILKFIALQSISPVLDRSESVIVTSPTGAYSIQLEYNTYSVFATLYDNKPINCGQIVLNSTVATGLDLPTLLNGGFSEPTTPSWIVELQRLANVTTSAAEAAAASAAASSTSAAAAAASAAQASQISGLSTVAEAIGLAALPLPDVWAPLSDSLRLITGYGRDVLVGSDVVAQMVNFSRNSTATYIGKDGQLKTAAANEPRFEKEGLLIEGQSTNLIVSSEKDYVTGSSASNYTVETGLLLDGRKAVKFIPIEPRRPVGIATALASNATVTVGWHTASFLCDVDLTGDSGYMRGVTAPLVVRKIRDGLYRASVTVNIPTAGASELHIYPYVAVTITGLQLEALPFASSYIPTNGTAVTRAPDAAYLPAAGNRFAFPGFTVAFEGDLLGITDRVADNRFIDLDNDASSNRHYVGVSQERRLVAMFGLNKIVSQTAVMSGHCVLVVDGPSFSLYNKGSKLGTATVTGRAAAANARLYLLCNNTGLFQSNGHLRNLRIWHRALSEAQIKAIV